jgi:alkylation response protein AidB-like acyl-CoA dehydrogenase
VGIIVAAHTSLCTNHLMLAASDEQKRRWVPRLASGEWLGCWGLTEPGSGSDAGGARTTALRTGEGWVLNGSKTFITNGSYADCAVVLAVTDKAKGTHGGISAFVVEKGTPGFRAGKKENKLGLRASDKLAKAFAMRCGCWTAGGSRLRRWRWGLGAGRWMRR